MRRLLPLLLLLACSSELEVSLDGQVIESGHVLDLGVIRKNEVLSEYAELTLHNVGGGKLDIEAIELPAGVAVVRGELPAELPSDRPFPVRLGLLAAESGEVSGTVVIRHGRKGKEAFELDVSGEVIPYVQLDLQDWPEVTDAVTTRFDADRLVGAAAAIVEDQSIVWMEGFGDADREQGIAVDPSVHRFRWASLSKGLTATAAATLVDDGALSFDDVVSDTLTEWPVPGTYLPAGCQADDCAQPLPDDAPPVTLRMLLSHTAGVQHYTNGVADARPPQVMANTPETNTGMAWALEYFWDHPYVAVPGSAYSYTTFGLNLAGVHIEEASGEDLGALVEERISGPLDITTLQPDWHWDHAPDRVAHYRMADEDVVLDGDNDVSWKLAGGGFTSSVEDLGRYCAGLLGDVIVRPGTRDDQLWAAQPPATSYGLGFGVGGSEGARVISHTGAQEGTRTAILIYPDEGRCYVFMTNSSWADPAAYARILRNSEPR